jgi:hypothetical protein
MADAVSLASARLASGQLESLLALRTAGLDHMREAFTALAQQSKGKDLRLRELEQTVAELRAADRRKNDVLAQVEVEITEMRAKMQEAKDHYERLSKQVEQNAQRSVLAAQQGVAEMRTTLEATLVENAVRTAIALPYIFTYCSGHCACLRRQWADHSLLHRAEPQVENRQAQTEARGADGAARLAAEARDVHCKRAIQGFGAPRDTGRAGCR